MERDRSRQLVVAQDSKKNGRNLAQNLLNEIRVRLILIQRAQALQFSKTARNRPRELVDAQVSERGTQVMSKLLLSRQQYNLQHLKCCQARKERRNRPFQLIAAQNPGPERIRERRIIESSYSIESAKGGDERSEIGIGPLSWLAPKWL